MSKLRRYLKFVLPLGIYSIRQKIADNKRKKQTLIEFSQVKEICNFKKNSSIKGKGKGKRAFIIATGPSIKSQDLCLLRGMDCFTISNAFLHESIKSINPKFHFFAPFHPPLIEDNFAEWLEQADRLLPKATHIFLGHTDYKIVKKYNLFSNRQVHYLFHNSEMSYSERKFDTTLPIPNFPTGPQMIFPVLFYMGYSEINLIGCDHNNLMYFKQTRENFYSSELDIRKNSLGPQVWPDIITSLETQLIIFRRYAEIKEYCDQMNIRLYNLSPTSWLDFIDKKEFEELKNK